MNNIFDWQEFRLFQAQQILTENLNIPLRILRGDAFERLSNICPPDVYSRIRELAEYGSPLGTLADVLDEDVVRALSPDRPELRDKVSMALWLTPRSAPHPLYDELKKSTHALQALVRLNILKTFVTLRRAPLDHDPCEELNFPAGLVGLLMPFGVNSGDPVIVAGPCHLLSPAEEIPADSAIPMKPRVLQIENEVHEIVRQVERVRHKSFTTEDKTNLLVLSTAYFSASKHHIRLKALAARRVLQQCVHLLMLYSDWVREMPSAEWSRATQWIFFWQSERSASLLERYVTLAEGSRDKGEIRQFHARRSLSSNRSGSSRSLFLEVRGNLGVSGIADLSRLEFGLLEGVTLGEAANRKVNVEVDGRLLGQEIQGKLEYFYQRSVEDRTSNRAWQDYLAFDRLRHDLQHLKVEAFDERAELFTRRARRVVMADVAAFFKYESLMDRLIVQCVRPAPWIVGAAANTRVLREWLSEVAVNREKRAKSVLYRAIDSQTYQSRLIVEHKTRPFATALTEDLEQIPFDREVWGLEPADVIAVPVQFHDRLVGVLYLVAGTRNRFAYSDRVRLLSFVRMFEAELFEAKLLLSISQLNKNLGEALRQGMTPEGLFNSYMQEVGRLLAVQASILWWRSDVDGEAMQVRGVSGDNIGAIVKPGVKIKLRSLPFRDSNRLPIAVKVSRESLPKPLNELPWPQCTFIPLLGSKNGELVGAVSLHGKGPVIVEETLGDELGFFRGELSKNIEEFMEHQERLGSVREMIAHGVQSALMHIDNIKGRLRRFRWELFDKDRQDYDLQLGDLERGVERARFLLDWLTRDSIQGRATQDEGTFFAPFKFLRYKLANPLSVHEVVKTAFHGRAEDLSIRGMRFRFVGSRTQGVAKLWLEKSEVEVVFTNLVDNLVKYGTGKQIIIVEYSILGLKFCVTVISRGIPLRADIKETPDKIFEEGVRGVSEETAQKAAGKGQGLYAARELTRLWEGDLRLEYGHGNLEASYRFVVEFPRWLSARRNPWLQSGE